MATPHLPLGIPLMDEDHAAIEALFARVNTTPDDGLGALFDTLASAIADHFSREQALMEAGGFPGTHCHVAQHGVLLDQFAEGAKARAANDHTALRYHLATVMPQLIESHVFTLDRITAAFLKGDIGPSTFDGLRLPEDAA